VPPAKPQHPHPSQANTRTPAKPDTRIRTPTQVDTRTPAKPDTRIRTPTQVDTRTPAEPGTLQSNDHEIVVQLSIRPA